MRDVEGLEQLERLFAPLGAARAPAALETEGNVGEHGHVREEAIVLWNVAEASVFGRDVDVACRVEQHLAVELDAAAPRAHGAE